MPDDDASSIEIPLESRESLELEHARMDRNSGGPPVSDARAEDVAIEQNLRHQLYTKIASGRKRYLGQLLIHLDQFIIAQLIFMYYLEYVSFSPLSILD